MPIRSESLYPEAAADRTQRVGRLAFHTALAAALSLLERLLPLPLPGMKPGLANIVILLLLFSRGFQEALLVALLKTFVVALFAGGLFAPGHLLALSGSLAAVCVMGLLIRLPWTGVYGISAAGAWAHAAAQLAAGYLLFLSGPVVLALAPPFLLFSLAAGLLTGHIVRKIFPDQERPQ